MSPRRSSTAVALAAFAALAALLVAAILILAHHGSSHHGSSVAVSAASSEFQGAALPAGTEAPGFTLTDQQGRPVSLIQYRGQVVVLSFIDSTCAPACVLIAQQIRGALDELDQPVPVLFVSVDPTGDTPANVRRFLAGASLTGRATYLTGPASALPRVWRAYRVRTPAQGRAAFERAAPVLLIDPQGDERVLYEQEQLTPESLAHDIGKLQDG